MSDNNTQLMPIETPIPDPANTRTGHDIAGIANSLRTFGQVTPIVLDADGIVRKGNGTLMAAKSLGWTEILVRQTDLHGAKAAAYSIADNRLADKSVFDDDALAKTLAALQNDESIDELCTGFSAEEIEKMIDCDTQTSSALAERAGFDKLSVIVECHDEDEQRKVYEWCESQEIKCRITTL